MASKMGWIVAAVLVIAVAVVIVIRFGCSSTLFRSGPTPEATERGFTDLQEVGISLATVLGSEPGGPGNAADDYSEAAQLRKSDPELIAEAMRIKSELAAGTGVLPIRALPLIRKIHSHVAAGAAKREMKYTFVHTPEEFVVGFFYEPAEDLYGVYEALEVLFIYHYGRRDYEQAAAVLKDCLVLGRHMTDERVRAHMVRLGLVIQRKALGGLLQVYNQWDREKYTPQMRAAYDYNSAVNRVLDFYDSKQKVVWKVRDIHPGDLFHVVENDKDLAWRVQALLALGVAQYTNAGDRADVQYARKLFEKYVQGDNRFLAAAAKAAMNFKEEELHEVWRR